MKPERWQQIDMMLEAALERAPDQRGDFLDEACAGDQDLRREVESLLAAHDGAGSFIEAPAMEVAARLVVNDQAEPPVGHSVGSYRVIRKLGRGGMGEVYLAEDMRLSRNIALKLLPAYFIRDEGRLRRFQQEARTASALNHPNILTIYEIGEVAGRPFIATEYIEGETLRQQMTGRRMKLSEVLDAAAQVASALGAAHAAGIVHRDIKPENIMVRQDGYVKVLDFGLAKPSERKIVDPEAATQVMVETDPNVVMGTVSYMSPEQVRGLKVDARSDIWSLGVVLYEMVAGRMPFEGATTSDVIVAILEREPPALGHNRGEVPAELQRIVKKALRKEREERYQNVKDMSLDLRNLRRELETEAEREYSIQPAPSSGRPSGGGMQAGVETARQSAARSTEFAEAHPLSSTEYIVSEIKRHKRGALFALATLITSVVVASYYFAHTSKATIDSVAVLPLINVGADPNTEWLSDGITESVIYRLSQLPSLRVIARNSVFRYKGRETDAQSVGHELGVQAVLTGRVIQRGDGLVISAELVDARDNRLLWGEQYNRKLSDVLALQEEIAKEISEKLRLRLTGEEQKLLAKHDTQDAEAYQLYLKGLYYWQNVRSGRKAVEYFQQAVDKDPNYALAYAGLASAFVYGYPLPPKEALAKAKAAALKAVELDDTLSEAHASLGYVRLWADWDYKGAENEFERALELNPNYPTAHFYYGWYLTLTGRFDEAEVKFKRAFELDPLSTTYANDLGRPFYYARQYDQAAEHFRKALEMDPKFWRSHDSLGSVYEQKGMYDEAVAEYLKKRSLMGDSPETVVTLSKAYKESGWRGYLQKEVDTLLGQREKRYVSPTSLAIDYALLGEKEKAFEWLQKAYEERDQNLLYIKVKPEYDILRSDPRFTDLVRRVGLNP